MNIDDFIWLDEFTEKLEAKHGVYIDEVEEVFANQPVIRKIERAESVGKISIVP